MTQHQTLLLTLLVLGGLVVAIVGILSPKPALPRLQLGGRSRRD